MPLPDFKSSEPFTLGIELELQVVNPPGYDLSQDSSALIAAVKDDIKGGEVKHDITESMLEIATGVCQNIDQAAAQFSVMQQSILRAAAEQHIQICGGGTHPFQKWQRQEVCDDERYNVTLERFGYLILQATVFGQHVHCSGVVMLCKADMAEEMANKTISYGVLVVAKPLNRAALLQAIRMGKAMHGRMMHMKAENDKLQKKLEELRCVSRAKCILIEREQYTEEHKNLHRLR